MSAPEGKPPRLVRWTSTGVVTTVAIFVVLFGVAAFAYPGGTWFNPQRSGYDLVDNFLCDTLHASGLNGQPNPIGSVAMTIAMIALVPGLGGMWALLPRLTPATPRVGRVARAAGLLSLPLVAAVPMTPSDAYPAMHAVVVVAASSCALFAAALAVYGLLQSGRPRRAVAWIGIGVVLTVLVDAGLYAQNKFFGAPLTTTIPALQKLAVSFLLSWMVIVALHSRRPARPRAASEHPAPAP